MEISKEDVKLENDIRAALALAIEKLLPIAESRLADPNVVLFQPGHHELAIVLTTEFNCSVAVDKKCTHFQLFMNYGLIKIFREMTRMFSRGVQVVSETEANSDDFRKKGKDVADFRSDDSLVAKELLEAFWETRLPNEEVIPVYQLNQGQTMMHNLCLCGGIQFIIAHELAHVILDVCEATGRALVPPPPKGHEVFGTEEELSSYRDQAERFAETSIRNAGDLTNEAELLSIKSRWGLEFAADRLGLEMSLETDRKFLPIFYWGAAEWFFILCDLMYRYYLGTRDASIDILSTHPPPHLRLRHLREVFRTASFRHDIGAAFKMRSDMILESLCPDAPKLSVLGSSDIKEQEALLAYQHGLKIEASMAFGDTGDPSDIKEATTYFGKALELYGQLVHSAREKSEADRYVRSAADCYRACGRLAARATEYGAAARFLVQSLLMYLKLKDVDGMNSSGQEMRKLLAGAPSSVLEHVKEELSNMGVEFRIEGDKGNGGRSD